MPSKLSVSVHDWLEEEQRVCALAKDTLRAFREKSLSRTNLKRVPANYQVEHHVLAHQKHFLELRVGKFHAPHFGPYKIPQVGPGSVLVRLSPTLGGEIRVGHPSLRKFPLELQHKEEWFLLDAERKSELEIAEGYKEEGGEEDILDVSETEAPEAPTTRSKAKGPSDPPSNISGTDVLPDINAEDMAQNGNYVVHYVLRNDYRHGWKFLVKFEGLQSYRSHMGTCRYLHTGEG